MFAATTQTNETGQRLGYACICTKLRQSKPPIFTSRGCIRKTLDAKGPEYIGSLALQNATDLLKVLEWNEARGIRFFRISSDIIPWKTKVDISQIPQWPSISEALFRAGEYARNHGHRLTFHPDHFVKLASLDDAYAAESCLELEMHSMILDIMGYVEASPENKLNIHMGGTYGNKRASMERWASRYMMLTPRCRARVTIENDDRPNSYSVRDLVYLHAICGVPITFDLHHHKFCDGGLSAQRAMDIALGTWPPGIRPVVHWSESQEGRRPHAHSDYVSGPIIVFGRDVDVMIEAKMKEESLLRFTTCLTRI